MNAESLEAAFDGMEDAVCVATADHRIHYLNPAAERLLGVRRDDALGRLECDLVCKGLFTEGFCERKGACPLLELTSGRRAITFEGARTDGKTRDLRVRCLSVPGEEGSGGEARLMLLEDVTASMARAVEGGDWDAMAAEDLLAPLNTLRCVLEVLAHLKLPVPPLARYWTGIALRDVRRLHERLGLYFEIRRLASPSARVRSERVVVSGVAWRSAAPREGGPPAPVQFDMPLHLSVIADPDLLLRVLQTLVANAHKHGGPGQPIRVSAEKLWNARVRVTVADSGEGFIPKDLARLFDRAHQVTMRLQGRLEGSGLGLTYCKAAVKAMGGTLEASAGAKGGTEFRFDLPEA